MTASIRGGIFTMAMLLKGAEVAKALTEELHAKTEELKKNGVEPCLAILRVGAREDDLAYERGALKRCEKVGVAVRQVVLPEDVTQEVLMENIHALGADEKVHGVLMFRPLPGHLDDEAARAALDPKKDMDGITDGSMTAVYAGTKGGYPPCTAAACVALLKHYNIPIKGKRVVVIGRSLVIGKPVSLLLLAEHATVTICHSRTQDLAEVCRRADILVAAVGKAGFITALYVVLVPVFGLFFRRKISLPVWIAVALSVLALYLLCIKGSFSLSPGDLLILICAVCFAVHILVIDHFTAYCDGVRLSCLQFLFAGVISTVCMFLFEDVDFAAIWGCILPLLYVGIFSCGVGYTLQILAQKGSNPTVVTILLSLESVFAVIAGAIILKQQMSVREYIGCGVMFAAVLLAQIDFPVKQKAE